MSRDAATDELDMTEVATVLSRHRKWAIGIPVAFFLLAVIYLHLAEPRYLIELQVTPTASTSVPAASGLGNLASLAGISIPGGSEASSFDLYLEAIKSRETAASIAQNGDLLKEIFAPEWDEQAGEWVEPGGLITWSVRLVKALLGASEGDWRPPGAERVDELVDNEVVILRDRNSPVVSIQVQHAQPGVGIRLLTSIHESVDAALRRKELDRTTSYVDYLEKQLQNVSVTEYRQALHDIIAEQEKRRMVASSDLPFAAQPFGVAYASPTPVSPRPLTVLLAAIVLGLVGGVLAALIANRVEFSGRANSR